VGSICKYAEDAEEFERFEETGQLASHVSTPYTEFAAIMN